MDILHLKPSSKAVTTYYQELEAFERLGVKHEMAVRDAFQALLKDCCKQAGLTFVGEWKIKRKGRGALSVDGAMVGFDELARGYWEAKDAQDDLSREVKAKFAVGYPKDNIIFQSPQRAILYQNGRQVLDEDITHPERLVGTLKQFFEYRAPLIAEWEEAAAKFQERVPELAESVFKLIDKERKSNNKRFIAAFEDFSDLCRASINPNLSNKAVEEMLVQHLLTERIFRNVFDNPDFTRNNIIAAEIEKVIQALTSQTFSRTEFLKSNDYFYRALEETARTIEDYSQKQTFLNKVYERFFQGFSAKVADTHGIVYTPQPIVNFMVKSVEDILQKEFGKSLSDAGVHILDPFVGTGNFMLRVMQEIKRTRLQEKYTSELHCNEVMLLPYYIASMNIEHTFFDLTKKHQPFEGICLVDTFELAESKQRGLFTEANTERIERQKRSLITVIIGNPPYNATQQNEMDLNKNRQHKTVDDSIRDTYINDSKSVGRTTRKLLFDPYVKAFRWASTRIQEGILVLVTNNSFIHDIPFDGMREHLERDFDAIYCLDLGGNVRKNPKLSGTTHNVFGIQVGVSINILVKRKAKTKLEIFYSNLDEYWRKEQKLKFLDEKKSYNNVGWTSIKPNKKHIWITEGLRADFDEFIAIGSKEAKSLSWTKSNEAEVVFNTYSLGVSTNRDVWLYNFNKEELEKNIWIFCETYNSELDKWKREKKPKEALELVTNDETKIKWSSLLIDKFKREKYAEFESKNIRLSAYRPFAKQFLYFDKLLIDAPTLQSYFFPNKDLENDNRVIAVTIHSQSPFISQMLAWLPNMDVGGRPTQCFPYYVHNEDGTNRRENITDWALAQFRTQYKTKSITKLDIFHYVYALLHHPTYRTTYAANLKRELPRIPFVKSAADFRAFVKAGERLADLHVNYEAQAEYPLKRIENEEAEFSWSVERMRLSKDKRSIVYNDFLTLEGIPPEAFEYRLGNRSALEWIIDQYQVSTDKRSGITNDPNRADEPDYIVRLIGKVTTVSVETVNIVRALPELQLS